MVERQRLAKHIDGLVRQKRISKDQLLHLMWIFSQEENVKITRNMTRRLLRLEKYSEETIKKVTAFLVQVEKSPPPETADLAPVPKPTRRLSRDHIPTEYDATADNQLEMLREQDMKRRRVRTLQKRAAAAPMITELPTIAVQQLDRLPPPRHLADADILIGWLVKQTKHCKSSKKTGPTIAAPYSTATALPVHARVIPKRKKRRKPRKRATTAPRTHIRRAEVEVEAEEEYESSSDVEGEQGSLREIIVEEEELGQFQVEFDEKGEEGEEDEDEVVLLDEDEEEEGDSLVDGEDIIGGEELSDDLSVASLQFGSDSDE